MPGLTVAGRRATALGVLAGVIALHALALRGWPAARPAGAVAESAGTAAAPAVAALQVRALTVPAPEAAPRAVSAPPPPAAPAAAVAVVAPARPVAAVGVTPAPASLPASTATPVSRAEPEGGAPFEVAGSPPPPAAAAAAAEPAPPAVVEAAETVEVAEAAARPDAHALAAATPVYPTRLPPPFRWTFRMQRGLVSGTGTLTWALDGERYRLALEGSAAGVTLLEWVSQGGIDPAGVAPERFVMSVRTRAAQAANFQRGAGKITYSGRAVEHPLPRGAQDRLSWLVQLAGVVAAAPERYAAPGAEITFYVSGVRGDVGLWHFGVVGLRDVDTPAGRTRALVLRREALRPFDTRGEVWLDPERHHLPVRVVLSTIDGNGRVSDSLALDLQSAQP